MTNIEQIYSLLLSVLIICNIIAIISTKWQSYKLSTGIRHDHVVKLIKVTVMLGTEIALIHCTKFLYESLQERIEIALLVLFSAILLFDAVALSTTVYKQYLMTKLSLRIWLVRTPRVITKVSVLTMILIIAMFTVTEVFGFPALELILFVSIVFATGFLCFNFHVRNLIPKSSVNTRGLKSLENGKIFSSIIYILFTAIFCSRELHGQNILFTGITWAIGIRLKKKKDAEMNQERGKGRTERKESTVSAIFRNVPGESVNNEKKEPKDEITFIWRSFIEIFVKAVPINYVKPGSIYPVPMELEPLPSDKIFHLRKNLNLYLGDRTKIPNHSPDVYVTF